jgi:hypothetical protein
MTSTGCAGTVQGLLVPGPPGGTIALKIHYDPQLLSPNLRLHWRQRAKRTQAAREAARLAWLAAGSPVSDAPVVLHAILRRARRIDDDNAWGCLKALRDGVFTDGVTPNDSPAWVSMGTLRQQAEKRWKGREEVIFIIQLRAGA